MPRVRFGATDSLYGVSVYVEGKDLIPTFATFVTCLVIAVEYGILIGVGINLLFLLYPSARPTVQVEKSMVSFPKSWVGKVDLCGLHV